MKNYKNNTPGGKGLSVIGFCLTSGRQDPDLYTLIVYDDKDSPIVVDGQIVFFDKPELVINAYELADVNLKQVGPPPENVDLVCDVAMTLQLISHQSLDESSIILNCLNTIFDLVQATRFSMPSEYKRILYAFADHLTFHREFGDFFSQQDVDREKIIDAILWCVGAVTVKARLLA